jgi:hypothetical protein
VVHDLRASDRGADLVRIAHVADDQVDAGLEVAQVLGRTGGEVVEHTRPVPRLR